MSHFQSKQSGDLIFCFVCCSIKTTKNSNVLLIHYEKLFLFCKFKLKQGSYLTLAS